MAFDPASRRLLVRLEGLMDREFARSSSVHLAFSAGLGSTLLAAVARKRGELTCVVVGSGMAPDIEAAHVAESYLDYRLEKVSLSDDEALSIARRTAKAFPLAALGEILDLVPVVAARRRTGGRILTGFGVARPTRGLRRVFTAQEMPAPLDESLRRTHGTPRPLLTRVAMGLGLPPAFARPRRRPPAEGSGVRSALAALAEERHCRVADLVRPHDFH